ncbi:hypothetical protein [Pseudoalteromonas sp. BSi20429]
MNSFLNKWYAIRLVDIDYQLDLIICQHLNANNSYYCSACFLFIYKSAS